MTAAQGDEIISAASQLLDLAAAFWPPVGLVKPVAVWLFAREVHAFVAGVQAGTIIPDGRGGYVPATNSHVRPDGSLY